MNVPLAQVGKGKTTNGSMAVLQSYNQHFKRQEVINLNMTSKSDSEDADADI
jgi:hypothetical protein